MSQPTGPGWPAVLGPHSLIQGHLPADHTLLSRLRVRRLEAVVLTRARDALVHYHRDQRRPDHTWVRGEVVSAQPAGPGAIAQLPGRRGLPGDLHVLVPETDDGAVFVGHYVRASHPGEARAWRRLRTLEGESAALVAAPDGLHAVVGGVHLRFTGDDWTPTSGPLPPGLVPPALPAGLCEAIGRPAQAAALAPTDLDAPLAALVPGLPRGWWQALVQEGESVFQYHGQTWQGRVRWTRAGCLRFDPQEPFEVAPESSVKLAQVTGERDTQPGASDATLSFSETRSGIRGTDLGVHVRHDGRDFLLFGDSHWRAPWRITRDAIGEVTPDGPIAGLPGVELHGSPLAITRGLATSREYDVPLDGFSFEGQFLAFFSSQHFLRHQVMGRSLLARARDPRLRVSGAARRRPIVFDKVGNISDRYFVNVSVQRRDDRLYLWGSGSYRADDLRLAELDLTAPAVRAALLGRGPWTRPLAGLRYFAGGSWSPHEADARPVVRGAFGEISVRWVPELARYVLLAMDAPEDPIGFGVTLRTASEPWGPWTPRVRLFDWFVNGQSRHDEASRFIRAHHDGDPVGDRIFRLQGSMTGAAYAPYLFDSRRDGDDVVLRYTLSTWNPYQVVLMQHRLPGVASNRRRQPPQAIESDE